MEKEIRELHERRDYFTNTLDEINEKLRKAQRDYKQRNTPQFQQQLEAEVEQLREKGESLPTRWLTRIVRELEAQKAIEEAETPEKEVDEELMGDSLEEQQARNMETDVSPSDSKRSSEKETQTESEEKDDSAEEKVF